MPPQRARSALPILFGIIVIDLIGFGIVMPVLPFWAKTYGANGLLLGALLTCHSAMQALFAPLWGRLADRIGRRPVMLATIAGTSLALLLLGLADSLHWLFAARILSGIFAANISVATAYVGDVTDEQERTRWMGMVGASFSVGFVVGPAIGGGLSPYGYGVPMLAASALAAANFLYALVALKEPESHRPGGTERRKRIRALENPLVRRLCLTYFLFSFAVTQLETIFAFFMLDRFGYDAHQVAFIFVVMAVVMGAIQGGAIRPLAARFREKVLLLAGISLLCVAFAAIPWQYAVGLLMIPLIVSAVGRAISHPSMLGMVSLAATPTTRGAVMGAFQASASLARVVGPLAAGALYDHSMAAPFLLASALMAVALGIASRLEQSDTSGC